MKKKIVTLSLAAIIGTSSLYIPYSNGNLAFANELEERKQDIQNKQSDVNSNIEGKQGEISELEAEKKQLDDEIKRLDMQISETNGKIRVEEANVEATKLEIEKLKQQIEEVKARIQERNELLEERARSLQESGGVVSYLDVLLGAQSFSDFVSRVSAVSTIVEADREIIKAHENDMKTLEQAEADLNSELQKLEKALTDLENLKNQLNTQASEKAKLIKQVEQKQDEAMDELNEMENEAAFLAEQATAVKQEEERARKAAEEEKQRQAAEAAAAKTATANSNSGSSSASQTPSGGGSAPAPAPAVTSGNFMWPAKGSFTSPFGSRWGKLHAGIDIANRAANVPIVASASGTVIRSNYSSSYGNVVYISHRIDGKVFTTLYAHMDASHVSAGQSVSKGQQIGIMGNTGHSTGKHLHFEIHNGAWNGQANAVNPLSYLQ